MILPSQIGPGGVISEKNILCFAFLYCINYLDFTGQFIKGGTVSGQMKGIAMHFPVVPVLLMLYIR